MFLFNDLAIIFSYLKALSRKKYETIIVCSKKSKTPTLNEESFQSIGTWMVMHTGSVLLNVIVWDAICGVSEKKKKISEYCSCIIKSGK